MCFEHRSYRVEQLGPNETFLDFLDMAGKYGSRFVATILAGGIIGLERQLYDKPAGLRTCILVSVGCCLFTMVSILTGEAFDSDPTRITAQIVSGIGFIGAGVILHFKNRVKGITTAATIFICAAIGVTCGSGYIFTGVALGIMVTLLLLLLKPVDRLIDTHPFTTKVRAIDRSVARKLTRRKRLADVIIQEEGPDKL